jgi:hypothetical protein
MGGDEAVHLYDRWNKEYESHCTHGIQGDDLRKNLVNILYCVRQYKHLDDIRILKSNVSRYHEHRQYVDYNDFWQSLLNKKNQERYSELTQKP